ncbi:MAG TPA: hypothetical protein VGK17_09185 [Propionicimonas sp.]|jgi:hypothetical protein
MAFKSPMLDAWHHLVPDAVQTVTVELNRGASYLLGEDQRAPEVKSAATDWLPVPPAVQALDAAMTAFAETVYQITFNPDLTPDAKTRQIAAQTTVTKAAVAAQVDTVTRGASKVLDRLRTAAYPPRPTPIDATQEVRVQGIKADLQMVLAPTDSSMDLITALRGLLMRAIADGDQLTAWVLASTRWPEDYLTSRGGTYLVEAWGDTVAQTLDELMPSQIATVRHIYNAVANPQRGISVLTESLPVMTTRILDSIASSAPVRR